MSQSQSQFRITDLQDMLVDTLNKVSKGSLTPAAANAAANLAGKYIALVKTEIDYNKLQGHSPNLDFFPTTKNKAQIISRIKGDSAKKLDHQTGEILDS